ncbi:MAG: hypothetical protein ACE5JS_10370 [Nitrospinota bacterium]
MRPAHSESADIERVDSFAFHADIWRRGMNMSDQPDGSLQPELSGCVIRKFPIFPGLPVMMMAKVAGTACASGSMNPDA